MNIEEMLTYSTMYRLVRPWVTAWVRNAAPFHG